MLGFSWGAFLVYIFAVCFMILGGFYGLVMSHFPVFLVPILMGLFFFYLAWEAVMGDYGKLPPPNKQR